MKPWGFTIVFRSILNSLSLLYTTLFSVEYLFVLPYMEKFMMWTKVILLKLSQGMASWMASVFPAGHCEIISLWQPVSIVSIHTQKSCSGTGGGLGDYEISLLFGAFSWESYWEGRVVKDSATLGHVSCLTLLYLLSKFLCPRFTSWIPNGPR